MHHSSRGRPVVAVLGHDPDEVDVCVGVARVEEEREGVGAREGEVRGEVGELGGAGGEVEAVVVWRQDSERKG